MHELIYSPAALKQLEKLEKQTRQRILLALERLRLRPESCDIKKLIEMPGYRFRVGDYRVVFDIDHEQLQIFVLEIGHRKNIYK